MRAPFQGMSTDEAAKNVAINTGRVIPAPQELPPFSGGNPTCAKCGQVGAATNFMGYGECIHPTGASRGWWPNERLHRECNRCGYQWDEATV